MNSPTPTTWRRVKLGDLLSDVIGGGTPSKSNPEYWGGGIPWASVKDMSDGAYSLSDTEDHITELGLSNSVAHLIPAGSVITSTRMGLGRAFINQVDVAINQDLKALIPKEDTDNHFLLWLLVSRAKELQSMGTGSTVMGIRIQDLKSLSVSVPDLKTQKEIAAVLGAYDDLIEVNEKKIKALEEVAQAVYREWFVHFRFPGHEKSEFVDSPLGRIPKGWEVKKLGGVVENFDSKRRPVSKMKRAEIRGIYPYYGAAKVIDYVDDYIFDGKYLLLAEDGSVIRDDRTPMLQLVNEKFWPNNHTHILRGGEVSTEYLYLFLRGYDISGHITGVAQPKINQENLNRIELLVAQSETLKAFDEIALPIIERVFLLQKENANLSQTRDLLLPKLMSGEVLAT